MAKITFEPRTGKDLFEFMSRASVNANLAEVWAIEKFVKIDDKTLEVFQIANLTDTAFLMISSKLFPMNDEQGIYEDNLGVHFNDLIIKERAISRDFITQIQTASENFKNNKVSIVKYCIEKSFCITINQLESLPYGVTAYLVGKVNSFLTELTTARDEFQLDDVWLENTPQVTDV